MPEPVPGRLRRAIGSVVDHCPSSSRVTPRCSDDSPARDARRTTTSCRGTNRPEASAERPTTMRGHGERRRAPRSRRPLVIRDQLLAALARRARRRRLPRAAGRHRADARRRTPAHGDFTTNVALQLAKPLGHAAARRRRQARRRARAGPPAHLERVEVAGPGLPQPLPRARRGSTRSCWRWSRTGEGYGHGHALDGLRINLEFVSANPTGPLHAGGGRWVAVGDALANLLAAQGADVHREYYLNDAGNQLDTFAASLLRPLPRASSRPTTATRASTSSRWPSGCAPSSATRVTEEQAREWGYRDDVRALQDDLDRIGVHFDTWFSERTLHEAGNVVARARRPARARCRRTSTTAPPGCAPPTSATSATACW